MNNAVEKWTAATATNHQSSDLIFSFFRFFFGMKIVVNFWNSTWALVILGVKFFLTIISFGLTESRMEITVFLFQILKYFVSFFSATITKVLCFDVLNLNLVKLRILANTVYTFYRGSSCFLFKWQTVFIWNTNQKVSYTFNIFAPVVS